MFITIVVSLMISFAAGYFVSEKYGKKVSLRIGDIEAKGRTAEEVGRLFEAKAAAKLQAIKKVL